MSTAPTPCAPRGAARGRGAQRGASTRGGTLARGGSRGALQSNGTLKNPFAPSATENQNAVKSPFAGAGSNATKNSTVSGGFSRPSTNGSFTARTGAKATGSWADRYATLKPARERERNEAVRKGLMSDPNKRTTLAGAITPVGTCQDMCPEYERVQRAHEKDVWKEETDPAKIYSDRDDKQPDELRMVKKFRRAAAGDDEQLPSDLRPPNVLKKTCDYLFNDLLRNSPNWAVTSFIWDRTRAIRNDFSIQQVSKLQDVRIAIECYERIARFHILSMHQCALPEPPSDRYDYQQDREQLDRTLLSLMQLYDDTRGRIPHPNEPEFRAYLILFQIRIRTPDIEDRVQSWPKEILLDQRVQTALKLYAAACDTTDQQGPVVQNRMAPAVIAQQHWQRFWDLVQSRSVSYLMACVAEIYFQLIRRQVLNALVNAFRASRGRQVVDWTLSELCRILFFDYEDEAQDFCEKYGFSFQERDDGQEYIDLNSVGARLPAPEAGLRLQIKSEAVEAKRWSRTMPAVINGMSVREAREAGEVNEEHDFEMGVGDVSTDTMDMNGGIEETDETPLFVPETQPAVKSSSFLNGNARMHAASSQSSSPFAPLGQGQAPTLAATSGQTVSNQQPQPSPFSAPKTTGLGLPSNTSPFNFLVPAPKKGETATPTELPNTSTSVLPTSKPGESLPSFGAASKPSSSPFASFGQPNAPLPTWTNSFSSTGQPPKPEVQNKQDSIDGTAPPFHFTPPAPPTHESTSSGFKFTAPTPAIPKPPSPFIEVVEEPSETDAALPALEQNNHADAGDAAQSTSSKPWVFAGSGATAGNHTTEAPSVFPDTFSGPFKVPDGSKTSPSPSPSPTRSASPPTQKPPKHATSTSPAPPNFSSGRKPSDSKVKTPSPLSHSLSASDTQQDQPVMEASSSKSAAVKQAHVEAPTFTSIVARLAEDMTLDPVSGFLKQYIDFTVSQTITEVQERLYYEYVNAQADEFRRVSLETRYGRMWRDVCRKRRLDKKAREARERRRQGLGSSHASSVVSVKRNAPEVTDRATMMDSLFQSVNTMPPPPPRTTYPESSTTKPCGYLRGTRSRNNLSHVDKRGRVAKPSTETSKLQEENDVLKRSSFLGFSLPSNASNMTSTTKTNYFRLKAMGIKPIADADLIKEKKRRRSEAFERDTPDSTSISKRLSAQVTPSHLMVPGGSSASSPISSTALQRSSEASERQQKADAEDEALFARLRAAREDLKQSGALFQKEMAAEQDLRKSLRSSIDSNESPSMARARAEARERMNKGHFGSSTGASGPRDVPAYRLRESRFVPRHDYSLAIERSREMRTSRPQDSSRPTSQTADRHSAHEDEAPGVAPTSQHSVSIPEQASHPSMAKAQMEGRSKENAHDYLTASFLPQAHAKPACPGFSQSQASAQHGFPSSMATHAFTGNLGSTFGNNHDHSAFLHASNASFRQNPPQPHFSFDSQTQPTPHVQGQDHTVSPWQIPDSLSKSFGAAERSASGSRVASAVPGKLQSASQNTSEVISLLSNSEDGSPEIPETQQPLVNGHKSAESSQSEQRNDVSTNLYHEDQDLDASYGHANPFDVLAGESEGQYASAGSDDDAGSREELESHDEMIDPDLEDEGIAAESEHDWNGYPPSQSGQEITDEGEERFDSNSAIEDDADGELVDGEAEEDDELGNGGSNEDSEDPSGEEEEDTDLDVEDDDDEGPAGKSLFHAQYNGAPTYRAASGSPFVQVGHTVDEPIELDSD